MKKFYMILAAIAAMSMSAQAQSINYGAIEVGDFENASEIYNGSYFDMAPTTFYLAHTGAQMIYTVDELAELQNLSDVMINKLTFKFNNAGTWEDIYRDVKLYLQEIDDVAFAVNEDGVKQFFTFGDPVLETSVRYEFMNTMYEDVELALELTEPFALTAGKSLLVTVVFDAEDDDNCTSGNDYAPFYTSGIRGKAMVYTDNWTSFIDYAQGEDFPNATAMLGCGTNVELPVTLINYSYSEAVGVEEIEAAQVSDNTYYNLMGQKFNGNNLPAGIYIHNGKKVVIR
ncbi:MAG: hypothetical protein IKZ92_08375 [Muribaculaceae bacterium]|nr:hypothetical protein [Muribaculaceae bacterium]